MLPFEEARAVVRGLGLQSQKEWAEWCKSSGKRPPNIPAAPYSFYAGKGWVSFPDWLGYDRKTGGAASQMLPFEEARAVARGLGLQNQKEWTEWCKSGQRPPNIPACPYEFYAGKGWVSQPDWLGYERTPAGLASQMLPFEEAREVTQKLGLQTQKEWKEWCKSSGQRPPNIPAAPSNFYAGKGWMSYPDWLGYDRKYKCSQMLPFEEARTMVRGLGLHSQKEWKEWCKSGQRPPNTPSFPSKAYAGKGWVSFPDWLGCACPSGAGAQMLPFEEARAVTQKLGLQSQKEWVEWCKSSGQRPSNIPAAPYGFYAGKGWVSFPDWLGYDRKTVLGGQMLPFEEARAVVRDLGLQSQEEWTEWCKSGQRPPNIPTLPSVVYAGKGWVSQPDWLGYEARRGNTGPRPGHKRKRRAVDADATNGTQLSRGGGAKARGGTAAAGDAGPTAVDAAEPVPAGGCPTSMYTGPAASGLRIPTPPSLFLV